MGPLLQLSRLHETQSTQQTYLHIRSSHPTHLPRHERHHQTKHCSFFVGAGNLGKALMNYNRWNHVVGEIVCAFDIAPEKVGEVYQIPVYPLNQMREKMPAGCRIAILTISSYIQETVDLLIELGIKGIVDFTHEHIQVPKEVSIKQVDVVSMIQELVFETNAIR
jgi:redox-sensing transcriptional repressor